MKSLRGTFLGFLLILGCLLILPARGAGAATLRDVPVTWKVLAPR